MIFNFVKLESEISVGDPCRFVGPQRSLLVAAAAPVVLFGDETSFAWRVSAQLASLLAARREAKLLMTGRAQATQVLQGRRRSAGQSRPHKTKAYWSLGKAGLD